LLLLALCVLGLLSAFPAAALDPISVDMMYDRVIR
jgi:hypothetical protein